MVLYELSVKTKTDLPPQKALRREDNRKRKRIYIQLENWILGLPFGFGFNWYWDVCLGELGEGVRGR